MESTGWLFHPLFPGRIGIWKCWFLWREENRSTRRKTLGEGTRTNNKLNPPMTPRPGIEPGPHWWEASVLTTAPSLLPHIPYTFYIPYCQTNLRKFSIRFQVLRFSTRLVVKFKTVKVSVWQKTSKIPSF